MQWTRNRYCLRHACSVPTSPGTCSRNTQSDTVSTLVCAYESASPPHSRLMDEPRPQYDFPLLPWNTSGIPVL